MNDITDLTRATLSGGDEVLIQLVRHHMPAIERTLRPSVVLITWPPGPTIIDPKNFRDAAETMVKLFSAAHIALAAIKAKHGGSL